MTTEPARDEIAERLVSDPVAWQRVRWGWLENVRHDATLNATARLLAHSLVLDFANNKTLRCDPSQAELAAVLGTSIDTVRRAVRDLVKAGWITASGGCGRGHSTGFGFLSKARIVPLRPAKNRVGNTGNSATLLDPETPASLPPFSPSQRVANMPGKGGKYAGSHNNVINHGKNHGARADTHTRARTRESDQDWLDRMALDLACRIEAGEHIPPFRATRAVVARVLELELLTHQQLCDAGIDF